MYDIFLAKGIVPNIKMKESMLFERNKEGLNKLTRGFLVSSTIHTQINCTRLFIRYLSGVS